MGFRGIFLKTTALGLLTGVPVAGLAWYFGGLSVMFGVVAGYVIALLNLYAVLFTVLGVSGERPASSILLVVFSFPTRLFAIALALYLIAQIKAINIFTTIVTLVVVYTMFAFSELRFASLHGESQSKLKTW